MVLKPLNLIVQRLRSKAFSPVCLFRFSEFLPLVPVVIQLNDREMGRAETIAPLRNVVCTKQRSMRRYPIY
jgi:hypothetical protein